MVALTGQQGIRNAALSPACRLVLTSHAGLHLPVQDDLESVPVDLPELKILQALAGHSHADQDKHDLHGLSGFIQALEARGWIIESNSGVVSGETAVQGGEPMPAMAPCQHEQHFAAELPQVFLVSAGGFEAQDHEGRLRARLSPVELLVLSAFRQPDTCEEVTQRLCSGHQYEGLAPSDVYETAGKLFATGLLYLDREVESSQEMQANKWGIFKKRMTAVTRTGDQYIASHMQAEKRKGRESGDARIRVVPVMRQRALPPLALGMLMASARAYEGGRLQQHYLFAPDWEPRIIRLDNYARGPAVFLFSNYIWSHQENLELSQRVKQLNQAVLTVHGGPDAPKYRGDVEQYFRDNPHIDVVVHGEGEITLCHLLEVMKDAITDAPPDLSPLKHVPGLSFRQGEQIVRTAPREQVTDLDTLASPYLDSTFELYEQAPPVSAILETNRGCPYGCTFCDWGSATASKVRRFSLERVFAELEWCARHQVRSIFLADANFGMFERDAEIAEKVAELKKKYGYPKAFTTNYAKNKVKYLKRIVSALVDAGILTEGLLSLQTMDSHTLEAIDRSNIKTGKYDELAREFRDAGLPLFVDIMMGLPGSTRESFADDLQQCIDREVAAKIFQTEMLVNSPMNEPGYREKYRIETATAEKGWLNTRMARESGLGRNVVVATSTFTREDYDEMLDLRQVFRLFENFGILRHVARFMRQAAGVREIDFINTLRRVAREKPDAWPQLAFTVKSMSKIMAPPVSWQLFIEEVKQFILAHYRVPDDSALETVLAVQHGLLPARGRAFPHRLSLAHDYGAWHAAMVEAKDDGLREVWPEHVPRLADYPPAKFEISDPAMVCKIALGFNSDDDPYNDWELLSPVARYTSRRHLEYADSA